MTLLATVNLPTGTLVIADSDADRLSTNYPVSTVFRGPTGNEWLKTGASIGDWLRTVTLGSQNVAVVSQNDLPHTITFRQKVTGRTSTALMTTSDVNHIHRGTFTISGLTSETVTLTATRDNVAGLAVPVVSSGGTQSDGAALGNGTYRVEDLAADVLSFTKSAGTEACTLTFQGYP